MKLIITCSEGLVAELDGYHGPVPQRDTYISRPNIGGGTPSVMAVKSVTYGILDRDIDGGPFYTLGEPYVEVHV